MSLTTPAAMPAAGPKEQTFEIERVDYQAPEARGRIGGITAGLPLWKTTMTLGTLTVDQSDAWRAFFARQRGAQRLFLGWEIARAMPRWYPKGFPGGWNGAASSWSQSIDSNGFAVLTLNGLPRGLRLALGDYVDFRWGTYKRALVRIIEGAIANASGTVVVTVEPAVPNVVPTSGTPAVAHLDNPACLMKLVPQQSSIGPTTRRGAISGGTLVAVQDLIP